MRLALTTSSFSLISLAAALALPTTANAACPSVGGEPGNNTCIGDDALLSNTAGVNNTAMGFSALHTNTFGLNNTANGAAALYYNGSGSYNTASGAQALLNNTSGSSNTASGDAALYYNGSGSYNTASGNQALYSNYTGSNNTASGVRALVASSGSNNIALGFEAGKDLTTGNNNIAIGTVGAAADDNTIRIGTVSAVLPDHPAHTSTYIAGIRDVAVTGAQMVVIDADGKLGSQAIPSGDSGSSDFTAGLYNNTGSGKDALVWNTAGWNNTANGFQSMYRNKTGSDNVASGYNALRENTAGSRNTVSGSGALSKNTTGGNNVAIGYEAAKSQTTGAENTALGYQAGLNWTTGARNVAIGSGAGKNQTTGSNNIAIGAVGAATDTAVIRIGTKGTQTKAFMAGIRGVNVTGGQTVLVDANGQLGVASSSARYKQDIHPMGDASNRLLELRPVTFHYRQAEEDGSRPLQYGLIAEDVAAVMPELAVYNEDGTPESVAYQVLPSLLLNEYQKQAKELEAEKAGRLSAEVRLEALEAEMATIKLMLSKLASVQGGQTQLAAAP